MPEYPDITAYIFALEGRVLHKVLKGTRLKSPFLLRTVEPPLAALNGKLVTGLSRLGKRITFGFEDDLFLVLHLMIAGRLKYLPAGAPIPGKLGLFAMDFEDGTLLLTEAGTKKRASLHLVRGRDALVRLHAPGLEVLECTRAEFRDAITRESHTLKRTLTDPRILSGIGNAYSDEILFAARLSPVKLSTKLSDDEVTRLFEACQKTLKDWAERLITESKGRFPEKVTAFRPDMAVHGKAGKPCVKCGDPVQKIAYADNETNYCATCQTGGKLLADRSLSRLLKDDFPRTLDELEDYKAERREPPRSLSLGERK